MISAAARFSSLYSLPRGMVFVVGMAVYGEVSVVWESAHASIARQASIAG